MLDFNVINRAKAIDIIRNDLKNYQCKFIKKDNGFVIEFIQGFNTVDDFLKVIFDRINYVLIDIKVLSIDIIEVEFKDLKKYGFNEGEY